MPPNVRLLLLILLTFLVGCDDRERELRQWQQEQMKQIQRHAQENAETTRTLVAANAESRKQFLALDQDLQNQRNHLEQERQAVATARERVPLLAAALKGTCAILLGILALGVTGYLLTRVQHDDGSTELEETLLLELSSESALLSLPLTALPRPNSTPALTVVDQVASPNDQTKIPPGDNPCPTS